VKYLFIIILIYFSSCYSQTSKPNVDTTKKSNSTDTLKQIILNKENDTLPRKSLLELKTILFQDLNRLDQLKVILKNQEEFEYFTKEELASGLSKNQLIAYKKNKEMLMGILQKKCDDCWWYKVKSLGQ